MNFEFPDAQLMLRDQAARYLKDACPSSVVRAVMEGDAQFDAKLWRGFADMGWLGAVIPEEYGGMGGGYLELCILAEQAGRVLAPVPFASTAYMATRALLLAGSEEQKHRCLGAIAAGDTIGTVALVERNGAQLNQAPAAIVVNGKLRGSKSPVLDGESADFAIVSARDGTATDGAVRLYLVDLNQDGVKRHRLPVIDRTTSYARIDFMEAPAQLLGDGADCEAVVGKIMDGAATLLAFEQIGGADAALGMARAFALERKAFGRPIAGFQAMKHRLADMYVKNELARANAYYAAWALEADDLELPLAAAAARISATDAFEFASQENIHINGGMGYTWEVDCHLFYRRSRTLALMIGSAREWKERLAAQLIAKHT